MLLLLIGMKVAAAVLLLCMLVTLRPMFDVVQVAVLFASLAMLNVDMACCCCGGLLLLLLLLSHASAETGDDCLWF